MEDIEQALMGSEESMHDDADDFVPVSPAVMDESVKADGETALDGDHADESGVEARSNKNAEAGDEAIPDGNEIPAATLDNE